MFTNKASQSDPKLPTHLVFKLVRKSQTEILISGREISVNETVTCWSVCGTIVTDNVGGSVVVDGDVELWIIADRDL